MSTRSALTCFLTLTSAEHYVRLNTKVSSCVESDHRCRHIRAEILPEASVPCTLKKIAAALAKNVLFCIRIRVAWGGWVWGGPGGAAWEGLRGLGRGKVLKRK